MFNSDSTHSARMLDRTTIASLALLATALVITVTVYIPGLPGPLFLDDLPQLQGMIENSADNPRLLLDRYIVSSSGPFGRPVAMASFVGSAVTHGPDTWWWKFENLMLHLVTGLLVFWLTAILFEATSPARRNHHWLVAGTVAALWLVHPLHVSTVLYTVQRMTVLSTLFCVAGLICYAKGRQRQIDAESNGWVLLALSFVVFFPLAVLSKESALLFPVYCSLLEFLVYRFKSASISQNTVRKIRTTTAAAYVAATIFLLVNFSSLVLKAYEIRGFTFWERTLTELRIIVLYLSQLLIPVQSKMGFYHDDIVVSTNLVSPVSTLLSAFLLAGLIASAVYYRKRLPMVAFGILFFFAGHLLESSLFALEPMFEHRNYLPSIGIAIAGVAAMQAAMTERPVAITIAAVVIGAMSLITWQRALTWGSPDTMYEYMYRVHPQSKRLSYLFADTYTRMRRYETARTVLRSMDTGIGPETHKLLLDCLENGEIKEHKINKVLALTDGQVDGHSTTSIDDLTQAVLDEKCSVPNDLLLGLMDHLLDFPAESFMHKQSILTAKARVLESTDDVDGAVSALRDAFELQPDNAKSLYFAAHTLSTAGRLDEAAEILTAAFDVEQDSSIHNVGIARTVFLNVGEMYMADGDFDKALATWSQGILSIPTEALFYLKKTDLHIQIQQYDRARETLIELRKLDAYDINEHEYAIRRLGAAIRRGPEAAGA